MSTVGARVTLEVFKKSKRVARITGRAKTGANKLLRLTAVNGDQKATAKAKLTLR